MGPSSSGFKPTPRPLCARDASALEYAARRNCEIKAEIVAQDERESGKRALLNLGHTVGHAIEKVLGFGKIAHGEAVGIGTVAEDHSRCEGEGKLKKKLPLQIAQLLKDLGMPYCFTGEALEVEDLMVAVLSDKKREAEHDQDHSFLML